MRSLILNPWEVRGILDGKITQLVRPVDLSFLSFNEKPEDYTDEDFEEWRNSIRIEYFPGRGWICWESEVAEEGAHDTKCPFSKPGDTLKVLEDYIPREGFCMYRADFDPVEAAGIGGMYGGWKDVGTMPQEFSRLTLEVLSVRVERLQDYVDEKEPGEERKEMLEKIFTRWNTDYPETPWGSNPWVFIAGVRKMEV